MQTLPPPLSVLCSFNMKIEFRTTILSQFVLNGASDSLTGWVSAAVLTCPPSPHLGGGGTGTKLCSRDEIFGLKLVSSGCSSPFQTSANLSMDPRQRLWRSEEDGRPANYRL